MKASENPISLHIDYLCLCVVCDERVFFVVTYVFDYNVTFIITKLNTTKYNCPAL